MFSNIGRVDGQVANYSVSRTSATASVSSQPSNVRQEIKQAIQPLRAYFGNGTHLRGCCGPFCELIYNTLKKNKNLEVNILQLAGVLPNNQQRHAVVIVKNKNNKNESYLVDPTVQQFDKNTAIFPKKPFPVFESESYGFSVNQSIAELRDGGYTQLTPDFAMAYSNFFHGPNIDWVNAKTNIRSKDLRSSEAVINRLAESKFARLFNDTNYTSQQWLNDAPNYYQ